MPRRAMVMGLGLLVAVLIVFLAGKSGLLPEGAELLGWLESLRGSPWGLPATILVFCAASLIGVPQFALIAGAIALFGPWQGGAYAWVANMASGALNFWIGRVAGEEMFRRYAGRRAHKLSRFIGRNALAASAIVRNVPAGPALLVNMAFGVSAASFRDYWIGMGIGIIPKIAFIAFAGKSILAALQGNPLMAIGAALAAATVYAAIFFTVRRRMAQNIAALPQESVDTQPGETR